MKNKYLLFLLIIVSFSSYANNIDSLINVYKRYELVQNDLVLYKLCNEISYKSTDPIIKLNYAKNSFGYSVNLKSKKYIARSKYLEANAYVKMCNYSQAVRSFCDSKSLYESIEDRRRVCVVLLGLANVYTAIKQYHKAELNYKESINLLRDLNRGLKDSSRSIWDLKLGATILNLGELYRKLSLNDSAVCYFREAIQYCESNKNYITYAKGNIGLVYVAQNKLDSAQVYLNEAITYLQQQNDNYAVSSYLDGMAELYLKQNLLQKALATSKKSLRLAMDYGLKEQIRDASLRLSTIYDSLHNYENAFRYQKQYVLYKDSINNEEVTRQIANLQTEYEIAQKQKVVDQEKAKKETYRAIVIGLLSIAVLLIALIAILLYNRRRRKMVHELLRKQNQELKDANHIKNRFFSILSHDLRSPLAAFYSYAEVISLYAEDKDFEKIELAAEEMQINSNHLLDLLDNLLQWGVHQMNRTEITPSLVSVKELVQKEVDHLYNVSHKKQIDVQVQIPPSLCLKVNVSSMSIAVRNLINNALKFTPLGGEIIIRGEEDEHQKILEFSDNGIGMSQEKVDNLFHFDTANSTYGTENEKGVGLGLQLVCNFIQSHNAQLKVESLEGIGTTFRIVFESEGVISD